MNDALDNRQYSVQWPEAVKRLGGRGCVVPLLSIQVSSYTRDMLEKRVDLLVHTLFGDSHSHISFFCTYGKEVVASNRLVRTDVVQMHTEIVFSGMLCRAAAVDLAFSPSLIKNDVYYTLKMLSGLREQSLPVCVSVSVEDFVL